MPLSRYFRFRLRTLLVFVTSAALTFGWVTHSLRWIRQRHEALPWFMGMRAPYSTEETQGVEWCTAPGGLWLFGESGLKAITLHPRQFGINIDEIRRLFPETEVIDADELNQRPAPTIPRIN